MTDDQSAVPPPTEPTPDAPSPYGGWRGTPDVLAAEAPEHPPRRAPWALVGGIAVLVLALVGGVTYAVGVLSGGGTQPDDVLPAGALAYSSIDLDPPAGQKIDAFRFLRLFPALHDKVPTDGDVRKVFFDAVAQTGTWRGVDYDRDVAPWLGKRLGVAVYPPPAGQTSPVVAVALQVTDQDKSAAGLQRLTGIQRTSAGSPQVEWAYSHGYAVIVTQAGDSSAGQGQAAAIAKQGAEHPLSGDSTYSADVAKVADDGVAVTWVDLGAATKALGSSALADSSGLGLLSGAGGGTGRTTVVARFAGANVFEVTGRTTGISVGDWATHPVTGMDTLPASTVAALGVSDGDKLVPKAWASMRRALGDQAGQLDQSAALLRSEFGVNLPDDLATLLGSNLVGALDAGTGSGTVQGGVRVTTDVTAAQSVIDRLVAAAKSSGTDVPVVRRVAGSDLVLASTQAEASRLAAHGDLGSDADFRDALPDLGSAHLAVWADPAAIATSLFGGGATDENLQHVKGVGVTVTSDEAGTAGFRFRLVAR
jgi:hypothetical protein